MDEFLGLGELVARRLTGSRKGKSTQLPLADLLRQSVYSRIAGYADVHGAARLSGDPTFRLIGSDKVCERGAALTSHLQTLEIEALAKEENFGGLVKHARYHWLTLAESHLTWRLFGSMARRIAALAAPAG